MERALSILAVTNIYPSAAHPTLGVFVEQQIQGLREIGLNLSVFYVDRAGQGMGEYFRMLRPLAATVAELKPDILHVMYGGIMASRVTGWNRHQPKIVTFHGSDLLGENLSGLLRKSVSRIGTLCSRRAAKRADGVVIVSPNLRAALPRGLDMSRVRVIPCGISMERFHPMDRMVCQQSLGWNPNAFHVLFASNNGDPVKRLDLAQAAVATLQTSGVRSELHLLQGISNSDVPMWMNASDALILTSLHEGSPTVVKEALACGLPVVSVDVGDVAQRIRQIEGCHLALVDPTDLAGKLKLVQRSRLRVNARDQIQELTLQSIARHLEDFYRATLARLGRAKACKSLAGSLSTPC